jgi:hypothetical protein
MACVDEAARPDRYAAGRAGPPSSPGPALASWPGGCARPLRRPLRVRASAIVASAAVAGLTVGCATSFGQRYLGGALNAFVNSASAWLIAPFAFGAAMGTLRGAALTGLLVCVLQLAGYELTAELRGFASSQSLTLFWGVCAVIGGPVFGAGGQLLRAGPARLRGLGGALPASAFLAEGAWLYLHELHYYATAALWLAIGAVAAVVLLRGVREYRWLALTLPLGLAGEVLLTQIRL